MSKKSTQEEFITKAIKVHGDKYDYSLINYTGANNNIDILCLIHGIFIQTPSHHLSGQNCPKCSKNYKKTTDDFIKKSISIHGYRYDYTKCNYKKSGEKVIIVCKEHGEYYQTPDNHIQGTGCPKCGLEISKKSKTSSTNEFINKANKKHNYLYNYSKVIYIRKDKKVTIICKRHGEYLQTPGSHLNGAGCSLCKSSHGEAKITNWLIDNNIEFERQKRFINCIDKKSLPFDFYIEAYNLIIEYDGIQHFKINKNSKIASEKKFIINRHHDMIKNKYCINNKINLIRIPYTEIDNINEILSDIFETPVSNTLPFHITKESLKPEKVIKNAQSTRIKLEIEKINHEYRA